MPVETPDDIAAFFSEEEFGVSVRIDGHGPFVAIHEQGSVEASWGEGEVVQPTDRFHFPDLPGVGLAQGSVIAIVGTGEQYEVFGAPTKDDCIWTVTGSLVA